MSDKKKFITAVKRKGNNPNPRIGVLLHYGRASVRLCNVFYGAYPVTLRDARGGTVGQITKPNFRMRGLKWLRKYWPEDEMRKYVFGYGPACSAEWHRILRQRGYE